MAVVRFDLKDLGRLGVSEKDMVNAVHRLGMSLEGIGQGEASIDITPNRPDLLDINGFARAVHYLIKGRVPAEKRYSIKKEPEMQIIVTGNAKRVQPFIAGAVIKGVDLSGNNLKNFVNFTEKFCDTYGRKRKKISMGIYNYDSIKGPLTYDAQREGGFVPLGMSKEMSFRQILKEHPKGIEYSDILGSSRSLPVLKDSSGKALALIPIVNSEETKVTTGTRNLFIDITGNSRNSAERALDLIACIFIDMGAEVYPCEVVYKKKTIRTPQLEYEEVKIRKTKAEATLGFIIEDYQIISLLNRLGYVGAKYANNTMVYVPPYRLDVMNDQDIVEDIAIAYGYENIMPLPIMGSSIGVPDAMNEFSNRVATLMVGMGYSESMNPYLTNEGTNFGKMSRKHEKESVVSIEYAKTESITMLRTDVLPSLMQNLAISVHERTPQRLFETGKVFHISEGKVVESTRLAMVSEHTRANFSEMKSAVVEMLKFAGISEYKLRESEDAAFIRGRGADVHVKGRPIGCFGEISPKVLSGFRLEEPVVAAEVDLDQLLAR